MNLNNDRQPGSEHPLGTPDETEQQLDRLLHDLQPAPEPESVRRLQAMWSEVSGYTTLTDTADRNDTETEHNDTAVESDGLRRNLRGPGWKMIALIAVAAGTLGVIVGRFLSAPIVPHDGTNAVAEGSPEQSQNAPTIAGNRGSDLGMNRQAVNQIATADPDGMSPEGSLPAPLETDDKRDALPNAPLNPEADSVRRLADGRPLSPQLRRREQLEAVLVCLEGDPDDEVECCRPLLADSLRFESMLWQVLATARGPRRLAALTAVGCVGTERSLAGLVESLSDQETRGVALEALRRRAEPGLLAELIRTSADTDMRQAFLSELMSRRSDGALRVILRLMAEPKFRRALLQSAGDISPQLTEKLITAFDSRLIDERIYAAMLLGQRRDEESVLVLTRVSAASPGRWEPIAALLWNGSDAANQAILEMQKDSRQTAALQMAAVQLQRMMTSSAF